MIRPIVTYGSEIWTIVSNNDKSLRGRNVKFKERMMEQPWKMDCGESRKIKNQRFLSPSRYSDSY